MKMLAAFEGAKPIGLCDERCYNSYTRRCRCICDGRNHGAGHHAAERNSTQDSHDIWRELQRRFPKITELRFPDPKFNFRREAVNPSAKS